MRTISCFFWSFFDRIEGMKLYKSAHTVYKTKYHIVWITRYRRKILVTGGKSYLKIKLQEIMKYYSDWEYIEIRIKKDHVHLYMVIPPKYAVSKAAETIKKNTSRSLSRKFTFLKKVYWDKKGIWGRGYFVSTVGINEEVIRRYVQSQEEEETGQAKLEF
jgi:putative transposase